MLNRKGAKYGFVDIIIIVGIIAATLSIFGVKLSTLLAGVAPGLVEEEPVLEEFCGIEDISMKINDYKKDAFGTDPGLSSAVFVDTDGDGIIEPIEDLGDTADDGSTTVPVNVDYIVYGGWNAGAGTTYYTQKLTGNTNCRDPLQLNPELAAIDTTVTFVVLNDDGTVNPGTALSIDASETLAIEINVKTTAKEFYGNPELGKCNIALIEYNRTAYTSFDLTGDSVGASTSAPTTHTVASTTNTTKAWFVGPIDRVGVDFTLDIEAGTVDPGADAADFGLFIYDCTYDLDADTNAEIIGVEDEDDNDLGTTTVASAKITIS